MWRWIVGGVLLTLGLAFAGASIIGAARWQRATANLIAQLDAESVDPAPARFDPTELDGLPSPVQRFFRVAVREGQPLVVAAAIEHAGTFNLGDTTENWRAFRSRQRVVARRPGFVWDARIAMAPGLGVRVHDAYVSGSGVLRARLLGLVPVADAPSTPELAHGELMRFLAEATWYPTALLPSQGVQWEALDSATAFASLADGDVRVRLTVSFGADGLIESVRSEGRFREQGGHAVATPWEGRFWDYAERDGMRIPLAGEVRWLLPDRALPYWRGRITDLRYEFAR